MPTNQYIPPEQHELEISLFGSGYGEAIALHIGQGKWVLVDSYQRKNELSASLEYLKRIQVNISEAVIMIVATHWHDDHIRGISNVVRDCTNAAFVTSSALQGRQFISLVGLPQPGPTVRSSGLEEFKRIFEIRDPKTLKLAGPDRLLYSDKLNLTTQTIDAKIYALSPADAAVYHTLSNFAQMFPKDGETPKRIHDKGPNYCSIVLWVEVGQRKLLLGGDLEVTRELGTGWSAIIQDSQAVGSEASVFKIPHHGSSNAHDDGVWQQLLCPAPYAILAPYNCGRKPLPCSTDIKRILGLTPNAYSTARKGGRVKTKQSVVGRILDHATKNVSSKSASGHIRLRCKLNEPGTDWKLDLFGSACDLSKLR